MSVIEFGNARLVSTGEWGEQLAKRLVQARSAADGGSLEGRKNPFNRRAIEAELRIGERVSLRSFRIVDGSLLEKAVILTSEDRVLLGSLIEGTLNLTDSGKTGIEEFERLDEETFSDL